MVEQRVIIDHILWYTQIHPDVHIDGREEYMLDPVEIDGRYFVTIPNSTHTICGVKKDSEIKLVYF